MSRLLKIFRAVKQEQVVYFDFWFGFDPNCFLIHRFLCDLRKQIKVIGPFSKGWSSFSVRVISQLTQSKADFFITGENREPEFKRAQKQIGFWRGYPGRKDVLRFPYWMWHLDWPDLENQPAYRRYGRRLSIDRLMKPISESYSKAQLASRLNRTVLFSKHLNEPRRRLFQLTNEVLGCDGFGGAFGSDNRQQPKMPVMEGYRFSLCPENAIGDGYITEKIPEAFHSGCVPISWCRPDDLAEDFNPKAVVNLYGLDDLQCREVFAELAGAGEYLQALLTVPLLRTRPRLEPLIEFIQGA